MPQIKKVISVEKRKSKTGRGVFYISKVMLGDGSEASGIGLYNVGEEVKSWFDHEWGKSKVGKLKTSTRS